MENNELTKQEIESLKNAAFNAHRQAEQRMHKYACALPLGEEREKAFDIYQNIRLATRTQ